MLHMRCISSDKEIMSGSVLKEILTHVLLGGLRLFIILVRPRIDDQMVGVVLIRPMIGATVLKGSNYY